jgi:hypothetical protein
MKRISLFFTTLLVGLLGSQAVWAQTQAGATASSVGATPLTEAQIAVNQDNYAAWDVPEQAIGPNHRTTFRTTKAGKHEIVEIGTGMNYWNGTQWSPSVPQFVATKDGFVANQVQHQVHLGGNLIANGSVTVQTPDGIVLNSTPLAIALYDSASGDFQVIATVTNCAPTQVSSNEVMYIDAFSGSVCASVVYTITAGKFHQDVMITGHLDPADYGFPTNTTQIQILTEFYNAPTPDVLERPIYVEQDPQVRAKMVAPDLVDEELGFGQFVMTTGKAYVAPNEVNTGGNEAPVVKEYKTIAGRTYLFESVPFMALAGDLLALPSCGTSGLGGFNSTGIHGYAGIPKPTTKPAKAPEVKLASYSKKPGVVIDYVATIGGTLSGTTVFKGDTTYLVSSAVTCTGPAIIEGGAVFKYKSGTSITLNSTLTCKTGMYRPAVFTGVDDNTVGDTMNSVTNSGYTGTISSSGYANPALAAAGALTFSNLRFRYTQEAIKVTDSGSRTWVIQHSQFIDCVKGVEMIGSWNGCGTGSLTTYFNLDNCLMSRVQYPVNYTGANVCGVYYYQTAAFNSSTVDRSTKLGTNGGFSLTAYLRATNSVFANLTALTNSSLNSGSSFALSGNYNGFYSATTFGSSPTTAGASPFQTVGAGAHYLTSTFRDLGTTNLTTSLAADLKLRTTYPPTNITQNTTLTTSQSLTPQVQRDTDTPDLGYHYDPIDYAYANVYVTNAAVTMSNGVVVATFGTNNVSTTNSLYGLGFGSGSSLSSLGTPNLPNWFVLYNTVMENVGTNGNWQVPTNSITGELYNRTPAPAIYTRFTSWSVLAQDAPQFYAPTNTGPIAFQDSEFHGGKIITYRPTIDLTNCLLERVYASLATSDGNSPYIRNSLFLGGTFNFAPNVTNAFVKDNFFDQTVIPTNTSVYTIYNGGYNGFVTGYNRLLPTNATDVVLGISPPYQAGPLGFYYQPTSSLLINKGHTTADQVGLYHYTVTTNLVSSLEIKETNSVVDIGYHYVAVDINGNPIDTDGDGLPDYLEDTNGNGIFDAGDLGDWLINAFNGLSTGNGLSVFTPLK